MQTHDGLESRPCPTQPRTRSNAAATHTHTHSSHCPAPASVRPSRCCVPLTFSIVTSLAEQVAAVRVVRNPIAARPRRAAASEGLGPLRGGSARTGLRRVVQEKAVCSSGQPLRSGVASGRTAHAPGGAVLHEPVESLCNQAWRLDEQMAIVHRSTDAGSNEARSRANGANINKPEKGTAAV